MGPMLEAWMKMQPAGAFDFCPLPHPLLSMSGLTWSSWETLPLTLSSDVLSEILDGGQSFRWHFADETWTGTWSSHVARLRLGTTGQLQWSAPQALHDSVAPALLEYLDLHNDPARLIEPLPWRSDSHLAECLRAFPGLRLLRQPFGETLLCFLCSATKQIVQIKQMVGLLASKLGREIVPGFHRLPTWSELASVSEDQLRACKLGFRARHVHDTARFLAAHPGWLETTAAAPYSQARERLCLLPGVGEKVADCVLLFGAARLEAFPVDVWILRTLERRYHLTGWKPAQLSQFGQAHFGPLAGLAQQYLFAFERRSAGKQPTLQAGRG